MPVSNTFSDNFNRTNSTTIGNGWTEVSGDFSILSNELISTLADDSILTQDTTTPSSADYIVGADIRHTQVASSDGWGCILGRYADANNYYLVQVGRGTGGDQGFQLYKKVTGSYTLLASYSFVPVNGQTYHLELEMNGTTIKGHLDGTQRIAVVDSAHTTAGKTAIRKGGIVDTTFWDNFNFTILAATTTSTSTTTTSSSTSTTSTSTTTTLLDPYLNISTQIV